MVPATGISRRAILGGGVGVALGTRAVSSPFAREGFAAVPGGKVWWRTVGQGPKVALLTIHGGPGAGHDYLQPLEALADERMVILYDQLGCGRSDIPPNRSLWNIGRFEKELDSLRASLGLNRIVIYGHSWGGWLAIDYLLNGARGVDGVILASTSASLKQYEQGTRRRLKELPGDLAVKAARLEREGKTRSLQYSNIVDQFDRSFLLRLKQPSMLARASGQNIARSPAYEVMQGINEFTVTGNLKGWNREPELSRIQIPTLILTSEFDEVTPDCAETLHRGIARSELVSIRGAAHLAMVEKPQEYVQVLRQFLAKFA